MWWLYQLSTPLNYLRIRVTPDGKWWQGKIVYDAILPIFIAVIITGVFWAYQNSVSLTGPTGMMADMKGLVQLLTAFFIAALAAVSTFQNDSLDDGLDGTPAKLNTWSEQAQEIKDADLTRRQFVCYLFGYLSFISIFLYMIISVSQGFSSEITQLIFKISSHFNWSDPVPYFRGFGVFVFSFLIGNLLTTTLLGLYFLTSGFHRPD